MKHRFALWPKFTSGSLADRIGWGTLAMAVVFLVYNLITAILDPVWQQWAFVGVSAAFLAVVFTAVQQMRAGRLRAAGWLLIISMEALTFSVVLLYTDIAILASIIAGAYALLLAPQTLPREETTLGIIQGLIVGSGTYIFDFLNPLPRTAPLSPQTAWILAAALLLLYITSLVRQFSTLDMRTKYMLGTLVGTAVVITGLVTYYVNSSTNILVGSARQRLHTSAQQTAREVDNFFTNALANTRLASVLPGIREFTDEKTRDSTQQTRVEEVLERLRTLNPTYIHSLTLVDRAGHVLASAPAGFQRDTATQNYDITYALRAQLEEAFISPVETAPNGRGTIAFVARVIDKQGEPVGALITRYHTAILQNLIEAQTGTAGPDSFALLVDNNQIVLAHGTVPETHLTTLSGLTGLPEATLRDLTYRSFVEMELHPQGHAQEGRGDTTDQAAIVSLESRPWQVLFAQPLSTLLAPVRQQARASSTISLAFLIGIAITTMLVANYLTRPVVALTETAQAISEGNLEARAPILSEDETGVLARTFNDTVSQLQHTLSTLEAQVAERTAALETRSAYLRTTTEVTSTISTILNPDILAAEAVNIIKQRFGLSYAGLFLRDSTGEWAELRAGTGTAGEKMLARGHRIRVGSGMVGWSILHGQPRIAQEAERDAVRLEFPELSTTRSEAALPLRSRGQVLGAITVQSETPNAFDQDTLAILQIMADQIAVALDNAYLFEESEQALLSVQRAFGELTRSAWKNLLSARPAWGYHYRNDRLIPAEGPWPTALQRALQEGHPIQEDGETPTLTLPLQVRGNTIGALQVRKPANALAWSPDEVGSLQQLTERIATALDNARLYQESQRRALQEQIRGQLLSSVHQQTTLEKVLSTAAEEIYDTLALEEITIQLTPPSTGGNDAHE